MNRTLMLCIAGLAALAVASAAFGSASSNQSLHVQPTAVAPGGHVHVYGTAGSCAAGSQLLAISGAFPGHGEGVLNTTVSSAHTFSVNGRIRGNMERGSYVVMARCGAATMTGHVHVS